MNRESVGTVIPESSEVVRWRVMLRDEAALLAMPGAHHKALLRQAHTLHQDRLINADHLSDMLELADAALAFAVESLLDLDGDE